MTAPEPFEELARRGGADAVRECCRYFTFEGPIHQTLRHFTAEFDRVNTPYAVMGALALNAHGFLRATVNVDVLVTAEGLQKIRGSLMGSSHASTVGTKNLRDMQTGVLVQFFVTGAFPGDGKPKPIAFPDPRKCGVVIDGIHFVSLTTLLELKLASGISNFGRMRDLADTVEMIKILKLPRELGQQLHPYVQHKYDELWDGVANSPVLPE